MCGMLLVAVLVSCAPPGQNASDLLAIPEPVPIDVADTDTVEPVLNRTADETHEVRELAEQLVRDLREAHPSTATTTNED